MQRAASTSRRGMARSPPMASTSFDASASSIFLGMLFFLEACSVNVFTKLFRDLTAAWSPSRWSRSITKQPTAKREARELSNAAKDAFDRSSSRTSSPRPLAPLVARKTWLGRGDVSKTRSPLYKTSAVDCRTPDSLYRQI